MDVIKRVVKTTITIVLVALIAIGAAYLYALFIFGESSPKALSASIVVFMLVYSTIRIIDFVKWAWTQSK